MQTIQIQNKEDKVEGYPYELISWQYNRSALNIYIRPFKKYHEEDEAIIVECKDMFTIRTTGKLVTRMPERYKSLEKIIQI